MIKISTTAVIPVHNFTSSQELLQKLAQANSPVEQDKRTYFKLGYGAI